MLENVLCYVMLDHLTSVASVEKISHLITTTLICWLLEAMAFVLRTAVGLTLSSLRCCDFLLVGELLLDQSVSCFNRCESSSLPCVRPFIAWAVV